MGKRLLCNFLVVTLMLSFSLFLNACATKVVKEENIIKQEKEIIKTEEIVIKQEKEITKTEENLSLKVEKEKAVREALLKEEAAKREVQSRKEFENEDIHFDFDKFSLADKGSEILDKKVSWLLNHPDVRIEIAGHCDERGTDEYNIALSEMRANSAMKYLIASGVKADRISAIGYGEEKPLDAGQNEDAWAKNRRANFRILPD